MYRQVWVHPDRKLKKKCGTNDPHDPLRSYQSNTVTFGMTVSSISCYKMLNANWKRK